MIAVQPFEHTSFIPCGQDTIFNYQITGEIEHIWEIREQLYAQLSGLADGVDFGVESGE